MIHSLAGGVIKENGVHTFIKVDVDGAPCWYLAGEEADAGDFALVPFGRSGALRQGEIVKVEVCSEQTAPYPMNRIKAAEKIFRKEGKRT